MQQYEKVIEERLRPYTKPDQLLHKLASGASEQIYAVAERNTKANFETDIMYNAFGDDLSHKANEFLYLLGKNDNSATAKLTPNGTGYRYAKVEIDGIVFTINQVKSRKEMVRDAIFRNDFAERLNPSLFEPYPKLIGSSTPLYVTITHGPISQSNRSLGFMNVGVVDNSYKKYIYFRDLFKFCSIKMDYLLAPVDSKTESSNSEQPQINLKKKSS